MPPLRTNYAGAQDAESSWSEGQDDILLPSLPSFLPDATKEVPLANSPSRPQSTTSSISTRSQTGSRAVPPSHRRTNSAGITPPVFAHIVSAPPRNTPGISSTDRKAIRARARDPSWIPRPRNPFIIFRCEFTAAHTAAGTESAGSADKTLSKRAADAWAVLPAAQKAKYKALAKEEADNHAKLYPEYRFKPNRRMVGTPSFTSAPRAGTSSSRETVADDQPRRLKVLSLMLRSQDAAVSTASPSNSNTSADLDYDEAHDPPFSSQSRSDAATSPGSTWEWTRDRRSSSVPLPSPPQALFGPRPGGFSGDDLLLEATGPLVRRASLGWRKPRFDFPDSLDLALSAPQAAFPSHVDIRTPMPSRAIAPSFGGFYPHETSSFDHHPSIRPMSEAVSFSNEFSFAETQLMPHAQNFPPDVIPQRQFVEHNVAYGSMTAAWPFDPALLADPSAPPQLQHPVSNLRGVDASATSPLQNTAGFDHTFWNQTPPVPAPYHHNNFPSTTGVYEPYPSLSHSNNPGFINTSMGMEMNYHLDPAASVHSAHPSTHPSGLPGHLGMSMTQQHSRPDELDAETLAMLGLPPSYPPPNTAYF